MPKMVAVVALLASCALAQKPVRVLIVSGENDHEWRLTTPLLERALENAGRFDFRTTESFAGATEKTLASYDALLIHYHGPRWGAETEAAVEKFVRSGKGLVALHGASYAFGGFEVKTPGFQPTGIVEPIWPEWRKMIGAWWRELKNGHGQRHTFQVRFTDREHPLARGMSESFQATDELYHNFTVAPESKVIGVAFDDPRIGGTGKDQPVIWTVAYGKGRTLHITLGHDTAAMYEPGFRAVVARSTEWAATGNVTVAPEVSYQRRESNALRVLVVTGGHAYDSTFASMFEDQPDIGPFVAPRNVAFNGDIRKRWDVLVFYDLTEQAGDKEKEVLRAFVESGKGVVVLHHAIAGHANWPWWVEEVSGGRYFVKAEGASPMSEYKQNQDIVVRPVGKHPITAGMFPLHLWEETYKKMWNSPKAKPLLETDAAASDRVVAWISPYEKSRVVYIQPGHDRKSHLHPAYRLLVRRAILWSGGRLN